MTLGATFFLMSICIFLEFYWVGADTCETIDEKRKWWAAFTSSLSVILAILLLTWLFLVVAQMYAVFQGSIKNETKWLQISLHIFAWTFTMKAIAISLEYFHHWPNPFYDKHMSVPISIFYIF